VAKMKRNLLTIIITIIFVSGLAILIFAAYGSYKISLSPGDETPKIYWYVGLSLITISVIGFIFRNNISIILLKREIERMRTEKSILLESMRKTKRRFKANKISAFVYASEMKRCLKRLKEIKSNLPILEAGLYKRMVEQKLES